jgi:hypothetical protein
MDLKELVVKWKDILEEGGKIKNPKVLKATALMLENEMNYMNEAGNYSVTGRNLAGGYATSGDFQQIAIPMVRRTFPELVAHDIVGVQPMTGPVGLAFALRFRAGNTYTPQAYPSGSIVPAEANRNELGYNSIDPWYSGTTTPTSGGFITSAGELLGSGADGSGSAADTGLGVGTYAAISEVNMTVEKAQVEAKTRKLRSRWSLEVAQDLKAMHGLDLEDEMMDVLAYEITAEIDREIINKVNEVAVASTWNYATLTDADGRWQAEKFRTLYSNIVRKANLIAVNTRRGAGNFVVVSPMVCAALEGLSSFVLWPVDGQINSLVTGVSKIGSLDGRITVYRDTFAASDYATVGYKGPSEYDAGVIYLPYVQLLVSKTIFEQSFHPTVGLMSRYALYEHIFGSNLYYQRITINNLPQ